MAVENSMKTQQSKLKKDAKCLTVKVLADLTGTSCDAIRLYSRMGLLSPERGEKNYYRYFTGIDVVRLKFIRRAKKLGYELNEIRKIFEASEQGSSPCPIVREIIAKRIKVHKKELDETQVLQLRMEEAVRLWRELPDGVPVGNSICHLIEQATVDL